MISHSYSTCTLWRWTLISWTVWISSTRVGLSNLHESPAWPADEVDMAHFRWTWRTQSNAPGETLELLGWERSGHIIALGWMRYMKGFWPMPGWTPNIMVSHSATTVHHLDVWGFEASPVLEKHIRNDDTMQWEWDILLNFCYRSFVFIC